MPADLLLIMPLLLPLLGAILCVLLWTHVRWQEVIAALTQLTYLIFCTLLLLQTKDLTILTTQVGNWPAPYGITLAADIFGVLMLLACGLTGLAVYLFSLLGLDRLRKKYGYYPLLLLLQMGVSGVCLTGDMFNLFVWFEVMLICCFALISLGGTKAQLEGALKYVTINVVASGLLLTGVGVLYSLFGSLNMAELAQIVRQEHPNVKLLPVASVFFLTGFGIKAAIFPLSFWLPASYHTPPIAVSAFIAGLITKVGIYVMIRLHTLIFEVNAEFAQPLLLTLAGFTMIIGVLGAAAHTDFRRILSFHIISQIGYMLMGLAIYTPLAIAGSIFFVVHNILVKTNLFLVCGVVAHRRRTFDLKKLGGIYLKHPLLSLFFLVSALSLAGIPPSSGFWGKLMLVTGGFKAGNYTIVIISLCVSLVTLLSMTKIWTEVFWKPRPAPQTEAVVPVQEDALWNRILSIPIAFLLLFILLLGLYPEPVISLSEKAVFQLLHSENYIKAVLK